MEGEGNYGKDRTWVRIGIVGGRGNGSGRA